MSLITTTKFHALTKALDQQVLKTDVDLLAQRSVRKRLKEIAAFCADLKAVSPESFNRLKQELAEIKNRATSHAIATATTVEELYAAKSAVQRKIDQIRACMRHNWAAYLEVSMTLAVLPDTVPVYERLAKSNEDRREINSALVSEIARLETDGTKPERDARAQVEARIQADIERSIELDQQIIDLRAQLEATMARLDQMYAETEKLIGFLTDQQKKRDQKKADEIERQKWAPTNETSTVAGLDNEDGTPIEFEDVSLDPLPAAPAKALMTEIYRWANQNDLVIKTDEDLAAARELYESTRA